GHRGGPHVPHTRGVRRFLISGSAMAHPAAVHPVVEFCLPIRQGRTSIFGSDVLRHRRSRRFLAGRQATCDGVLHVTRAGTIVSRRLGRIGRLVWSSWSGLSAIFLFCVVWQIGHEAYGAFILPSPLAAAQAVVQLASQEANWQTAAVTTRRALEGFALAALVGISTGIVAGYSAASIRFARPLITLILGVPPIAWIVLAMIWFG